MRQAHVVALRFRATRNRVVRKHGARHESLLLPPHMRVTIKKRIFQLALI